MVPRRTPGLVYSRAAECNITDRALQCKAELVMLLHFGPLFTAHELHKFQLDFPSLLRYYDQAWGKGRYNVGVDCGGL